MSLTRKQSEGIVLINPPFVADPSPSISIATLVGWLNKCKIPVRSIDLARDLLPRLITRDRVEQAYETSCREFIELNEMDALSPSLSFKISRLQMLLRRVTPALHKLESNDFDFRSVSGPLMIELVSFSHWPECTTAHSGIELHSSYNLYSSADLARAGESELFFTGELENLLGALLSGTSARIIGLSVVFDQQIIPAMQCARIIKGLCPDSHLVIGGPYVTVHLQHLQNMDFFNHVDSLICDEGEEALSALYHELGSQKTGYHDIPNLIWPNNSGDIIKNTSAPFLRLKNLPSPDYNSSDLESYTNPDMFLSFRLSKGCYWKRCAFCRVKLSLCKNYDQPPVARIYSDLRTVIKDTGIRRFLFSDESSSPEVLEELSQNILADGLELSWIFHTRVDRRQLTRKRVQMFAEAGCKGFTVGIETFNNRLLELMGKGITEEEIDFVLRDIQGIVPINAYMMLGFPTETEEEFLRSYEIIKTYRKHNILDSYHYSLFYLGAGSLMWHQPEKYGIEKIDLPDGLDLMPNLSVSFQSSGMSRYEAVKHYFKWMTRKIPANLHDSPVILDQTPYSPRYHPAKVAQSFGEHIIEQLDIPFVQWLERIDLHCEPNKARGPFGVMER